MLSTLSEFRNWRNFSVDFAAIGIGDFAPMYRISRTFCVVIAYIKIRSTNAMNGMIFVLDAHLCLILPYGYVRTCL
jgi:hypothetical protein